MAVTFNSFVQPVGPGDIVGVDLVGDPILNPSELVRFLKFGLYRVTGSQSGDGSASPFRRYDLQLVEKYSSADVPAGTPAVVEKEGITHSTMAYNSTVIISFREDDFRSLLLTGHIVFGAQHHAPGKAIKVRMRNTTGGALNLTFPTSWIFMGTKPTTIAAGRTAELLVISYETSDAGVTAAWAVQA